VGKNRLEFYVEQQKVEEPEDKKSKKGALSPFIFFLSILCVMAAPLSFELDFFS
jgi:hypothetical protein